MTKALNYDYSRSFVQWWNDRINHSPRCAIHASCRLTRAGVSEREFFLTHPCVGENMYADKNLIHVPVADFHGVFDPREEFMLVKVFADKPTESRMVHRVNETIPTFDGKGIKIIRIEIAMRRFPSVRPLRTDHEVYAAMVANLPILARTTYRDGRTKVICEYPVTVMNASHDDRRWQVDTGPILLPDFSIRSELEVGRFRQAFIVFNRWDWAEIAIRRPTKSSRNAVVMHPSSPRKLKAKNELFAAAL